MRFDGRITVPGDWVPFVLMSVSLGEGFYRLLCVHINRSRLSREREEKHIKKGDVTCSTVYCGQQGYDQRRGRVKRLCTVPPLFLFYWERVKGDRFVTCDPPWLKYK